MAFTPRFTEHLTTEPTAILTHPHLSRSLTSILAEQHAHDSARRSGNTTATSTSSFTSTSSSSSSSSSGAASRTASGSSSSSHTFDAPRNGSTSTIGSLDEDAGFPSCHTSHEPQHQQQRRTQSQQHFPASDIDDDMASRHGWIEGKHVKVWGEDREKEREGVTKKLRRLTMRRT